MPGEDTMFNRKVELKNLKKKLKREKRCLKTEVKEETHQLLQLRKN